MGRAFDLKLINSGRSFKAPDHFSAADAGERYYQPICIVADEEKSSVSVGANSVLTLVVERKKGQ
jgi:hypothetical protein